MNSNNNINEIINININMTENEALIERQRLNKILWKKINFKTILLTGSTSRAINQYLIHTLPEDEIKFDSEFLFKFGFGIVWNNFILKTSYGFVPYHLQRETPEIELWNNVIEKKQNRFDRGNLTEKTLNKWKSYGDFIKKYYFDISKKMDSIDYNEFKLINCDLFKVYYVKDENKLTSVSIRRSYNEKCGENERKMTEAESKSLVKSFGFNQYLHKVKFFRRKIFYMYEEHNYIKQYLKNALYFMLMTRVLTRYKNTFNPYDVLTHSERIFINNIILTDNYGVKRERWCQERERYVCDKEHKFLTPLLTKLRINNLGSIKKPNNYNNLKYAFMKFTFNGLPKNMRYEIRKAVLNNLEANKFLNDDGELSVKLTDGLTDFIQDVKTKNLNIKKEWIIKNENLGEEGGLFSYYLFDDEKVNSTKYKK